MLNLTNQKFGLLTVLSEAPRTNNKRRWFCRCKCGSTIDILQYSLRRGATISCGCKKRALGKSNSNWSGHQEITGSQWALIRNNAKHRKIEFDISIEEAWDLFVKQGRKCKLSGIPLVFSESYNRDLKYSEREETTASLDRIDSSKGYIRGNLQWVHKNVNLMKGSLPQDEFINLCKTVTKYRPHS